MTQTTKTAAIKRSGVVNNSKALKWHTIRFQVPQDAVPIIKDFLRKLEFYATESELAESTFAYSLWCKRVHHLTGPSFSNKEARRKMWAEIIADYPRPTMAGSFFEHRLAEIAKVATILLACFFLIGCVTGEKMSRLHPGMTKAEAVSILGRPDGFRTENGAEVLSWNNRLSSGWAHDRADYNVILVNGKVTEYGQGTVRPKENGTLVIIPLKPR